MHHRLGFTLIELSIVLVIIGLVIGGVVAGKELIETAKVRKEVSQLNTITTSINVFLDKYQMLPGDMTPARTLQHFNINKGATDTNGNKIIEGIMDGTPRYLSPLYPRSILPYGEVDDVYTDLNAASLLRDTAYPLETVAGCTFCARLIRSVLAPDIGIMAFTTRDDGKLAYFMAMSGLNWAHWLETAVNTGTPALTPKQAIKIDLKIDNGLPSTGRVLAVDISSPGGGGDWGPQYVSDGDCIVTGTPNVYNIGVDERLCLMVIRAAQ